jgi:hypothetical protein
MEAAVLPWPNHGTGAWHPAQHFSSYYTTLMVKSQFQALLIINIAFTPLSTHYWPN